MDSDDDCLADGEEALVTHTNPNDPTTGENQTQLDFFVFSGPDTDSDGLPDLVEKHYASDPGASDAETGLTPSGDLDGDGVTNLQAYWFGWDLLAYLNQYDMDGDGMTDAQEDYWGLDRAVFADSVLDPDGDGVMNYEEVARSRSPVNNGGSLEVGRWVIPYDWFNFRNVPYEWWEPVTDPDTGEVTSTVHHYLYDSVSSVQLHDLNDQDQDGVVDTL